MTIAKGRRCGTGLAAAAVMGFFFDVHIAVRDNGTGRMRAVYTATPISTIETERFRFDSPFTETSHVEFSRGLAGVRVEFSDVTKLSQARELANSTVELGPVTEESTRRIWARIRGPIGPMQSDRPARIRLILPGPVVTTTGERTSPRSVDWSAPIGAYFSERGIEIEATYRSKGGTGRPASEEAAEAAGAPTPGG